MTAVKIKKRRASKQRRMRRMTVAGGEKLLHSDEEEEEEFSFQKEVWNQYKTFGNGSCTLKIHSAPTGKW